MDLHPLRTLDADARALLVEAPPPRHITPMLASRAEAPFSDAAWLFERKLDGQRCLAVVDGDGGVALRSRSDQNVDELYPELLEALAGCAMHPLALDGEVVAFDGATTSFERLQFRLAAGDPGGIACADTVPVFYYVFDVLHVDGFDTTALPLRRRKTLLGHCLTFADPLRFTNHRNEQGTDYFREACQSGWEGLIAKDGRSRYEQGRSVQKGFTGEAGMRLAQRLDDRQRTGSPFTDGPDGDVHWVEPTLVCEIEFTEWTGSGRLRDPRYVGLRTDKPAAEVVREA